MRDDQVVVGRIGRPHGVRGEVTVDVRTDDPDARFAPGAVLDTDPPHLGPLTVERARWHVGRLLLRFTGVDDRTAAEKLRGTWLVVDTGDLPPLEDPDEFHDHELIGLTAVTTDGTPVGTVRDILHYAQDLLVIRRETGGEALVPFVAALVPEVDVAGGRIVIDPPPGLLDES
ncbi:MULTISPECIES: ribosome maturation factor RimM [Thermomonospora]|uniref:Ribosome maturation factor RimM n=1 Tax=Thermomonospora curvata (strain ATCC 19995 / DSM 43183 / JCM 3096 / KCTC 9072 / NBRC 15933 / NCIMB 10081 / Henssen B9) TaxID=471852 RepID=D1AB16_THECD|nr:MULTISPECIES: ribosome maturation factor RimM [Thermomonospora]ACY98959.1 16S rRNA processing protein RimM [Thermomonospora curvata DSM 43183]PKK13153.1 MAG: ribosome maturation factor RimM [Thermomonospora sp. CIF 1]